MATENTGAVPMRTYFRLQLASLPAPAWPTTRLALFFLAGVPARFPSCPTKIVHANTGLFFK